jgi:hypothetical protein
MQGSSLQAAALRRTCQQRTGQLMIYHQASLLHEIQEHGANKQL